MENNMIFINEVNLAGKVIRQFQKDNKEVRITMEVPGYVMDKIPDENNNYHWERKECKFFPQVTFKGERATSVSEYPLLYQNIHVRGKLLERQDKYGNILQGIVGYNWENSQEQLNEVILQGIVEDAQNLRRMFTKISINTRNMQDTSVIESKLHGVFYGPAAKNIAENTKVNSLVELRGHMSTQIKKGSHGKAFFENFVINHISRI